MKKKIVMVMWHDATSNIRWVDLEEESLIQVVSVGMLIKKTDKVVQLGMNLAEDGSWGVVMTIPIVWTTKIKVLSEIEVK